MSFKEKIKQRKLLFHLDKEESKLLHDFFLKHPEEQCAYLFYSGKVVGEKQMTKQMTSRIAQLVSIAYDGFSIIIGRKHPDLILL